MRTENWQSIETAPKDEMPILGWDGYDVATLSYDKDYGWGQESDSGRWTRFEPTHWMPLPEPPKEVASESNFEAAAKEACDCVNLLVVDVRNGSMSPDGGWHCDVELGQPGESDNPWLTVSSDDLERYPSKGDVLQVRKPKAIRYAWINSDSSTRIARTS